MEAENITDTQEESRRRALNSVSYCHIPNRTVIYALYCPTHKIREYEEDGNRIASLLSLDSNEGAQFHISSDETMYFEFLDMLGKMSGSSHIVRTLARMNHVAKKSMCIPIRIDGIPATQFIFNMDEETESKRLLGQLLDRILAERFACAINIPHDEKTTTQELIEQVTEYYIRNAREVSKF